MLVISYHNLRLGSCSCVCGQCFSLLNEKAIGLKIDYGFQFAVFLFSQ